MTMQDYIDEIKLMVTAGVLDLEIDDETLEKVVKKALKEVQRYITTTKLITVPFSRCIDLKNSKVSSVSKVYRTSSYMTDDNDDPNKGISQFDPMQAQMWMAFTNGGTMYNLNDYMLNFASFNTLLQLRNTTSGADLSFKYDKSDEKLYINVVDKPTNITIEYVPKYEDVEEITSDYWIDILSRLSIAMTKVLLGRVRSRYIQSNALWAQDGATMLEEGNEELNALRETLRVNSQLVYPID